MRQFTPGHLECYRVFDSLQALRDNNVQYGLYWVLRGLKLGVQCEIGWKFKHTQLGGIHKVSPSAEEAVYTAVQDFNRWKEVFEMSTKPVSDVYGRE